MNGQFATTKEVRRMIETQGLTHIHFAVRDLERSLRFYRDVFGLREKFRDGASMVFLNTPGASDTITLRQAAAGEVVGGGGGIDHFGFRLRRKQDLDAAIEEVVAAGGALRERGEHAPGYPFAYVTDPDGYTIEL
jgi:catechol 2,3-dioxygenase-like lactoylglutathione lyase family enzyme